MTQLRPAGSVGLRHLEAKRELNRGRHHWAWPSDGAEQFRTTLMRRAKSMGLGISASASISGASPLALVTTTGREFNLGSARCRSRNSQPLTMGIIRSRMIRDGIERLR